MLSAEEAFENTVRIAWFASSLWLSALPWVEGKLTHLDHGHWQLDSHPLLSMRTLRRGIKSLL